MAAAASSGTAQGQVCKPIVVGSCAWWLGKRSEETKSHEWTVYVRALRPKAPPLRYHSARFGRIAHWMYGSEVPVSSEEIRFSARLRVER